MASKSSAQPSFLAFASTEVDLDVLKKFAATHQWPETCVIQGNITTAAQHLKENTSPSLLLVEVPSAAEAPALLDKLAEVCDPDTKVIIVGNINEYSFYCWLTEIGIFSYLLKPLTEQSLETAYLKSVERVLGPGKQEKPPAKLFGVIGARGGVGTSAIALNLGGIIADLSKKHVAIVDLDPQEGSLALTLDTEPSRGFREALEKPERIDSLFVERVLTKMNKHLSILSSEESLQERIDLHEQAAEMLLKELRNKFDIVILDVPRYLNLFTRQCLAQCEQVVLATDLSLAGLRDTLRIGDMMREMLKMKPPIVVSSRTGLAPKSEMKPADFEKGIGAKIEYSIPFSPDVFMQVGNEIPAIKFRDHAAPRSLYKLAEQLVPEAKTLLAAVKGKKGLFKKKDKEAEAEPDKKEEKKDA